VPDQAAETVVVAAVAPIVAGVVAAEMVGMIATPAVQSRLDWARWVVTSVAKRGTGRATAGPS
jgi:hypothetical protein